MTVESLAVWVLFECIFRYTGDAKVLDTFFFNVDHLQEVKDAAAHGVLRLEVLLREILRREVQGRTSEGFVFDRDGRRRTYRKKMVWEKMLYLLLWLQIQSFLII